MVSLLGTRHVGRKKEVLAGCIGFVNFTEKQYKTSQSDPEGC
jgi:hypothetical protein